jgi:hypothetical protein
MAGVDPSLLDEIDDGDGSFQVHGLKMATGHQSVFEVARSCPVFDFVLKFGSGTMVFLLSIPVHNSH